MSGRSENSGACPDRLVRVSALRLTAAGRASCGTFVNELRSAWLPSIGRGIALAPALSMGLPARSVTPAPTVKSIRDLRVSGAVWAHPTSTSGDPPPSIPVTARADPGVQVPV